MREARIFEVTGTVQGVGFRPFVWRLAARHELGGWVRNRSGVVEIHAEGDTMMLDAFAHEIASEAPALARVEEVSWRRCEVEDLVGFDVDASVDVPSAGRLVSPDAATCPACLAELFDRRDRRYRYPFINCTDCGPRFTIIEELPYDRERTSMRAFAMCADCRHEYEDPADRRFHAEPIACPVCGPRLELVSPDGHGLPGGEDAVTVAAELLSWGATVALKGLGGFHLACDATDERAVERLRRRKHRPDKPFAVMVADVGSAREWFEPTDDEVEVLGSWRAPIVLVADRERLAPGVAPGHRRQGVMLPSTPLHHLLMSAFDRPLVMTSGNLSDEPICIANDEALARLHDVADAFLLHDREVVARYDDSVVQVHEGRTTVMRRARSYAPSAIRLPAPVRRPLLGVGAELHGAFCLASGDRAFLSQYIGDLDTDDAMRAYRDAFERYRTLFRVEPEAIAHDLHPDFLSTRFAEEFSLPMVAVQHHHAHVVATMAEHGLEGEVLGLAFDGFGLGDDGTAWGGEMLACDWTDYRRVGRLRRVRQPGGDSATRNPARMALAHACDAGVRDEALSLLPLSDDEIAAVLAQLETGLASPLTSSAGRLFDAVAALAGVCTRSTYEGQAAMLLEQAAAPALAAPPAEPVVERSEEGVLELDTRPLVAAAVLDLVSNVSPALVAARFHSSLAAGIGEMGTRAAAEHGLDRVVLGGGVFQNRLLAEDLCGRLSRNGLRAFLPAEVPVGDGGIALGQVMVANSRMEAI